MSEKFPESSKANDKVVDLTDYREGRTSSQNPFLMTPQQRLDAKKLGELDEGQILTKITDISKAASAAARRVAMDNHPSSGTKPTETDAES